MGRFQRKSDDVIVNASRFQPGIGTAGVIEHKSGAAFIGANRVWPGDWVIMNERGEFEVCEAELFAAAYEPLIGKVEG